MMICKADFDELFPNLFAEDSRTRPQTIAKGPNDTSLRRWEDDGGHPGSASQPREPKNSRQTLDNLPRSEPPHVSANVAKIYNHVALGTITPMLVCFGVARQFRLSGHPRTYATGTIYG